MAQAGGQAFQPRQRLCLQVERLQPRQLAQRVEVCGRSTWERNPKCLEQCRYLLLAQTGLQ